MESKITQNYSGTMSKENAVTLVSILVAWLMVRQRLPMAQLSVAYLLIISLPHTHKMMVRGLVKATPS